MAKQHNPDKLTPEQVGVSEGWRLLNEDEILEETPSLPEVVGLNCWLYMLKQAQWSHRDYKGAVKEFTYRTKLTREELAKRRAEG